MAYPALDWNIADTIVGARQIGDVLTFPSGAVPQVSGAPYPRQIGQIVSAYSATYGMGKFIYLPGVASNLPGLVGVIDLTQATPTFILGNAGKRGQVGVSTATLVAGTYGWYQIEGATIVTISGTIAAADPAFWTASAGTVSHTVVATDKIDGMTFKGANGTPAAGYAVAQLDFPAANGNG